jgi:hypothetical protein
MACTAAGDAAALEVLEPVGLVAVASIFAVASVLFLLRAECCGCIVPSGEKASVRCGACGGAKRGGAQQQELAARMAELSELEKAYKWNNTMFVARSKLQREIIALQKLAGGAAAVLKHVDPEEEEDALTAAATGGDAEGGGAEGAARCAQLRTLVKSGAGIASIVGIDLSSLVVKAVLNGASFAVALAPIAWWWGRPLLTFPSQWLTLSFTGSASGAVGGASGIFARFMAGPDAPLGSLSVLTWASICWSATWTAVQYLEPKAKRGGGGGGAGRAAALAVPSAQAGEAVPALVDEIGDLD